jgi:methionyl-tRNA formyltransferase
MENLNIIFAGTPDFAAAALQKLIDAQYRIIAVYTQPDRPAGRGRKLTPSPVKALAQEHHIPVEQPVNFKEPETIKKLQSYHADLMIVAAYGLLLPPAVLETPRLGCLNIHASLLPRWRGAAPIQRAILAGDKETGITIMQMNEGLDTGDMLLKLSTPINDNDSGGSLHDRLAELGGRAIVQVLQQLEKGQLKPEKQDENQANYAKKLIKSESEIDWTQSVEVIDRQIRAFNPWPGSQTHLDDSVIRIHAAQIADTTSQGPTGRILAYNKNGIDVQCGDGTLRLLTCQLPGSRAMSVADLYNGHPDLFKPGQSFKAN